MKEIRILKKLKPFLDENSKRRIQELNEMLAKDFREALNWGNEKG